MFGQNPSLAHPATNGPTPCFCENPRSVEFPHTHCQGPRPAAHPAPSGCCCKASCHGAWRWIPAQPFGHVDVSGRRDRKPSAPSATNESSSRQNPESTSFSHPFRQGPSFSSPTFVPASPPSSSTKPFGYADDSRSRGPSHAATSVPPGSYVDGLYGPGPAVSESKRFGKNPNTHGNAPFGDGFFGDGLFGERRPDQSRPTGGMAGENLSTHTRSAFGGFSREQRPESSSATGGGQTPAPDTHERSAFGGFSREQRPGSPSFTGGLFGECPSAHTYSASGRETFREQGPDSRRATNGGFGQDPNSSARTSNPAQAFGATGGFGGSKDIPTKPSQTHAGNSEGNNKESMYTDVPNGGFPEGRTGNEGFVRLLPEYVKFAHQPGTDPMHRNFVAAIKRLQGGHY